MGLVKGKGAPPVILDEYRARGTRPDGEIQGKGGLARWGECRVREAQPVGVSKGQRGPDQIGGVQGLGAPASWDE